MITALLLASQLQVKAPAITVVNVNGTEEGGSEFWMKTLTGSGLTLSELPARTVTLPWGYRQGIPNLPAWFSITPDQRWVFTHSCNAGDKHARSHLINSLTGEVKEVMLPPLRTIVWSSEMNSWLGLAATRSQTLPGSIYCWSQNRKPALLITGPYDNLGLSADGKSLLLMGGKLNGKFVNRLEAWPPNNHNIKETYWTMDLLKKRPMGLSKSQFLVRALGKGPGAVQRRVLDRITDSVGWTVCNGIIGIRLGETASQREAGGGSVDCLITNNRGILMKNFFEYGYLPYQFNANKQVQAVFDAINPAWEYECVQVDLKSGVVNAVKDYRIRRVLNNAGVRFNSGLPLERSKSKDYLWLRSDIPRWKDHFIEIPKSYGVNW